MSMRRAPGSDAFAWPANRYHAARCYVRSGAQLRNPGSNDTQAPAHFREDFRRPLELGTLVRGGHNGAQARLAFRDRGIAHGRSIQASVEQPARELERFGSLAHGGIQQTEGRLAAGRYGGWVRGREQEGTPAVIEPLDEVARAAHVAAHGANGLAERTHLDIDATVTAEMIYSPPPVATEHAGGVRVVHHHDAVVLLGEVAELRQRRDVALHGKHAVGD